MKKRFGFFLIVFLIPTGLFTGGLRAENHFITDKLKNLYDSLDTREIETGILYDSVLAFSHNEDFTGASESRTTSLSNWKQMFFEMRNAALGDSFLPKIHAVFKLADKHVESIRGSGIRDVAPVAIMNVRYDKIAPDALSKGMLRFKDGKLVRSRDIPGSPYVEKRVFAACALKAYTYRGAAAFSIPETLYFTNDQNPIRYLELDFDNGEGPIEAHFGDIFTVRYSGIGEKAIRLRAFQEDGTILESAFLFDVRALVTPDPTETWMVVADISHEGAAASGEAFIYLANGHAGIANPIVIVEGFDIDNSMGWDELYNLLNRQNLVESLRERGYDLVLLNFDDSTDYMQGNAFLVVKLIQMVNAEKTTENQIHLVGASMGGVVSRYALAYMEQNAMSHETRTFISFDAPEKGANIPLGDQFWIEFFASQSEDAATWLERLNTPAARQLLVYHHTAGVPDTAAARTCVDHLACLSGTVCDYRQTARSDSLRTLFMSELSSLGYPANLRKVAIANGGGTGGGQDFQPGDQLIEYHYQGQFPDPRLLGNSYALADHSLADVVFHGELSLIFCLSDALEVIHEALPYDNAPGGMRSTNGQLADASAPYGDISTDHPNHCFIPTISALDIDTEDLFYDIASDPDILSKTPFDAIYFPAINEEHVEITLGNAAWVTDEILGCPTGLSGISETLGILVGNGGEIADLSCKDKNNDGKIDTADIVEKLRSVSRANGSL